MLYFLYNQDTISVLVCHDIKEGEFVLQIPYYPKIQDFKEDFTQSKCVDLVRQSLFAPEFKMKPDLQIINVNTWCMEGLVADKM